MHVIDWTRRAVVAGVVALVVTACGGGEAPRATEAPPPQPTQAPAVTLEVPLIGGETHDRPGVLALLSKAGAEKGIAKETTAEAISQAAASDGSATVRFDYGDKKVDVRYFATLDALNAAAASAPKWHGALYVTDPGQSAAKQDEMFQTVADAGVQGFIVWIYESELLTDQEVYQLETTLYTDKLADGGYVGLQKVVTVHVAKAAAADAAEWAKVVEVVDLIGTQLVATAPAAEATSPTP